MSEKTRIDRCVNPYRKTGEKGHVGKNLRTISKSILQECPYLPKDSKICSDCRLKRKVNADSNNVPIDGSCESNAGIEYNKSSPDTDSDTTQTSLEAEGESRSVRELELEELLSGLKDKYASLKGNDPMKVRILTIAPTSSSIRKIAEEFGASKHLAQKSKE